MNRRAFLLSTAAAALNAAPLPNFIIFFADDMGYGDLACYGHPNIRTPHLDRMAAEGLRFTSLYAAAPVCTPSRVGLLTGRYPVRAGQPDNTGPDTVGGLPLKETLLPQILKTRGYKSMAVGKWHLGHKPKQHLPTHRGFDEYFGLPYSNDMIPPFVKTQQPLYLYRNDTTIREAGDQSDLTQKYTAEALRFIKANAKNPFFLYVPYAMPHLPISASAAFRGKSRAGLYGDVIEEIDWSVGQVLATLKQLGLDNNTLVFFTSDNGPWHDLPARMLAQGNEPWHTGSKGPLRGAKGTTYEGGPRVPAIARWPGVIPGGRVTSDIASTLDLLPTFAAAAGASLPADRKYDGFNLMPLLRGDAPSPRDHFYYFLGARLQGVREGKWKLRVAHAPELYDLDNDPSEMYNLAAAYPDMVDRLRKRMEAFDTDVRT